MKIHEILEACIEYIAIEGVLGSDTRTLQKHLATLDPSIDGEYFEYVYSLLIAHPAVLVIITAHPLPSRDGEVTVGTAPLPADGITQATSGLNANLEDLMRQGIKGRELAYHIAGKEYRTDKEAAADKRDLAEKVRQKKRQAALAKKEDENGAGPSGTSSDDLPQDELWRVVELDDGGEGEDKVMRSDIRRMNERWGSRFRIRVTDDEIYFRLIGTYQRKPSVTPIIFHILQLAARTREKGITAIDLGPASGASQGSLHYYMKILTGLGLCAKVPAVVYSAMTNLLVFHRFLNQNETYLAITQQGRDINAQPDFDSAPAIPQHVATVTEDTEFDNPEEASMALNQLTDSFPDLSEPELMSGVPVKKRLLKLLDHPGLKNHLLKNRELLPVLGWRQPAVMRHKRALGKAIGWLVLKGIVEQVQVGTEKVACLRLPKYNMENGPTQGEIATEDINVEEEAEEPQEDLADRPENDIELVYNHAAPYAFSAPANMSTSIEYQLLDLVISSKTEGKTIADLHNSINSYFKRAIEFLLIKVDGGFLAPHLQRNAITTIMESFGRERRLRAYSIEGFRDVLASQAANIDNKRYPPVNVNAGRWAEQDFRKFYRSLEEVFKRVDQILNGHSRIQYNSQPRGPRKPQQIKTPTPVHKPSKSTKAAKPVKSPKKSTKRKRAEPATPTQSAGSTAQTPVFVDDEGKVDTKKRNRVFRYSNETQIRGRPRKYVHVVNEDGRVNRGIIGLVYPQPELALVYVYVESIHRLVEAPAGYSGVGRPPPLDQTAVENAKEPKYFDQFPHFKDKHPKRKRGVSSSPRPKSKKKEKSQAEEPKKKKSKRDTETDAITAAAPSGDAAIETTINGEAGPSLSARPPHSTELEGPLNPALPSAKGKQRLTWMERQIAPSAPIRAKEAVAGLKQKDSLHEPGDLQDGDQTDARPARTSAAQNIPQTPNKRPRRRKSVTFSESRDLPGSPASVDVDRDPWQNAAGPEPQTPKAPSPMIGSDIGEGSFSFPDYSEPRENAFVLPAAIRAFKKKLEKTEDKEPGRRVKLEQEREGLLIDTDMEYSPSNSAQPSPTPLGMLRRFPSASRTEATRAIQVDSPSEGHRTSITVASTRSSPAPASPSQDKTGDSREEDGQRITAVTPEAVSEPVTAAAGSQKRTVPPTATPHPQLQQAVAPGTGTPLTQKSNETPMAKLPRIVHRPARDYSTPLREVTNADGSTSSEVQIGTRGPMRIDISQIKRQNELIEAIKDIGGVITNHKLRHHHRDWSARVAGTDVPYAPVVAALMDRLVFRRNLAVLLADGRLKETIATIPTNTGRWVKSEILYLPETPWEEVQAFIRAQSNNVTLALTPPAKPRKSIAAVDFTEMKGSTPNSGSAIKAKKQERMALRKKSTNIPDVEQADISPEDRRDTLLKDPTVIANLYGYLSGRNLRIEAFHRAMVRAFGQSPDSFSVISHSPKVFTLPLLIEELTAFEYFSVISMANYDEDVGKFLADPANKHVKMSELPDNIKAIGKTAASRFRSLLDALSRVRIVDDLVPSDPESATFSCKDKNGNTAHFKKPDEIRKATYFRLHDFAPIFLLAADTSSFIGVLPVQTSTQLDDFWMTFRKACLRKQLNELPLVHSSVPIDWSKAAPLTDVLDLDPTLKGLFRASQRWKTELKLQPVQRAALHDYIGGNRSNPEIKKSKELSDLLYEYALPRQMVEAYLDHHLEKLKRREDDKQNKISKLERKRREQEDQRRRAEASLNVKIAERQAQHKAEWENMVKEAAKRTLTPFTPDLVTFVGRQAVKQSSGTGQLTDGAMDEACRMFDQQMRRTALRDPGARAAVAPVRKAMIQRIGTSKSRKEKNRVVPRTSESVEPGMPSDPTFTLGPMGARRRRKWSAEDDELMLDCEAIIRARSRDIKNARGRNAIEQLMPDVGSSALLNRIKKILALPGKLAYYERLEDAWYTLWHRYRGTPELPDPNIDSIIDFPLREHVEFLRRNVKKNTLRMSAASGGPKHAPQAIKTPDLPADLPSLYADYRWSYPNMNAPTLEAYWQSPFGEVFRQRSLCSTSLLDLPASESIVESVWHTDLLGGKVQALLKMMTATPSDSYSPAAGQKLLEGIAEKDILIIAQQMCDDKILKKNHSMTENGRQYGFTATWIAIPDDPLSSTIWEEADHMTKSLQYSSKPIDLPLTVKGGEVAALFDAVSKDEVDFDFDIAQFPTVLFHPNSYNTRRLNDDDFEFSLQVKPRASSYSSKNVPIPVTPQNPTLWTMESEDTTPSAGLSDRIMQLVGQAGKAGLPRTSLPSMLDVSQQHIDQALSPLCNEADPKVFWAGYDTPRLIAISYREEWTVSVHPSAGSTGSTGDELRVNPRRWVDVYGQPMHDTWRRMLHSVLTVIALRGGQSETTIRKRCSHYLDRLEINDILQYLLESGKARREPLPGYEDIYIPPVEATSDEEGRMMSWYPITGDIWA